MESVQRFDLITEIAGWVKIKTSFLAETQRHKENSINVIPAKAGIQF